MVHTNAALENAQHVEQRRQLPVGWAQHLQHVVVDLQGVGGGGGVSVGGGGVRGRGGEGVFSESCSACCCTPAVWGGGWGVEVWGGGGGRVWGRWEGEGVFSK
jgi:hypothetical protein